MSKLYLGGYRSAGAKAPSVSANGTNVAKSTTAIAAYRLSFATGAKQAEIAAVLSREVGRPIKQNQISRMLKQVQRYTSAGNVLPDLPKLAARAKTTDPAKLDMGKRQTGRTERQRYRAIDKD